MKGTEPEAYAPEALADEEPRYLRRQRPLEIRRRRISKRAWELTRRIFIGGVVAGAAGWLLYYGGRFLAYSPRFVLSDLEQIQVSGNRFVSRAAVLEKFTADGGRNVLRVPLAERRRVLEEISWVEHATVRRVLPNGVQVELVERQPVAFLRLGAELALIDAHGVILERPLQGEFRFPVVTGITEAMPREERERRMKLGVQFLKEIELARAGAAQQVSEMDLSDASDVRATLAGLPELGNPAQRDGQGAVLVYFGDGDFVSKFRVLVENIGQWRANVGRVESVDLRFSRQVVVNPEARPEPTRAAQSFPGVGKAQ